MSIESTSWATVQDFLQKSDSQTADCFNRTKWSELCRIASGLIGHSKCITLDQVASGLNNIVRLLEFSDGTRWAARVHIQRNASSLISTKLENEVATMKFIKEYSSLPVPRVFAHEFDEKNSVGAAFILMEALPGSVAMDALGGYEAHRGVIPKQHRQNFYRSVARCHVQLTSLRLPKIGAIIRTQEGKFECGPLPGLGGPFDTATAFFEAWADNVKFKWDKETITRMMQRGPIPAERMLAIIEDFPSQIKSIASQLSLCDEGPFPLAHDDFLHSNIMVDENNFDVTGIIDWEGACTVPIELLAFPEFLTAMPISFDLPQKYDQDGQPFDEELRELWRERGEYIEMVRSAELSDSLLSNCLSSKRTQAIAYSYGAYTCVGKLGFYDQVIKVLESEEETSDN
ncbi:unnamed protein product [Penicillium salamii]|uniref:Aminoglycoside phosphotransferase domain-containing protein n=1 Tax=Penicillium salamii TaxID=1612424 RepID=A0A9W4JN98_9EURO|nr:unnamed protein product [Penicillium salamii]CAG8212253.1 unnamed protein product [Penicillium salamii]CAG8224782.1 unnamed protein product [Penicillium salamii]CAG8233154.1 unnamed protein product [Penicillium salamii]CAG8246309.1 unnamed protein product [Penicillium salamii]